MTLDTTRADRLGAYGYSRAITPALDALARRGVLFEHAYSSSPLTLPSHATLFTGLEPPEHGLHINGTRRLSVESETLAEVLRRDGYRTAAFVAAFVLDSRFGLGRGFDTYDDDLRSPEPQDTPERLSVSRPGDRVVDGALAWLRAARAESPTRPFFCWVHLYDAHYPYRAHAELDGTPLAGSASYDAEIAFADVQVGRLLEWVRTAGLDDRTLVVAVGDHGEGLGDHGEVEHGYLLNEEILRVPLVMALPGVMPAGRRVSALARVVDVRATVLELLGVPGVPKWRGGSILAAVRGDAAVAAASYAETDLPYAVFGWSPQRSLTTTRWKYIRTARPELYDRRRDAAERANLAGRRPAIVSKLERRLSAFERTLRFGEAAPVRSPVTTRERLEALGYLAPAPPPRPPDLTVLRDMKDMLPQKRLSTELAAAANAMTLSIEQQLELATQLVAQSPESPSFRGRLGTLLLASGRVDQAVAQLREALRVRPDHAETRANLGVALLRQGKPAEGIAELRRAIALDVEMPEALVSLAGALGAAGATTEAEALYREAVRQRFDYQDARLGLANTLARRGVNGRAAAHYRRILRQDPRYSIAHLDLAMVLARQGKIDAAIAHAREAVRLLPDLPMAHYQLAKLLAEENILDEAIAEYLEAIRLRPTDAEFRDNLAAAYAAAGRYDEASRTADQAVARARAARRPALARDIARRAALYRRMGRAQRAG